MQQIELMLNYWYCRW